jgi:DNA-binding response OmpR family regulator
MEKKKRILIIDDDIKVRDLSVTLLSEKYETFVANDGGEGYSMAFSILPDLIILDLLIPRVPGWDLCWLLRDNKKTKEIPIVVFTREVSLESELRAFTLGADDFMKKTCSPRELLVRIERHLRRIDECKPIQDILIKGDLTLDPSRLECKIRGVPVAISTLEFKLLYFFATNLNRVLNRQQILDAIWQGSLVSERTVDTHVCVLRRKIKESSVLKLSSLYGAGYILKENESRDSLPQTA